MSNGESQSIESSVGKDWIDNFMRALESNRTQAQMLLHNNRDQLRSGRASLDDQMQRLEELLARDEQQLADRQMHLERRERAIEDQTARLDLLREQLERQESRWNCLQTDLAKQQQDLLGELHEQIRRIDHDRNQLAADRREFDKQKAANQADPTPCDAEAYADRARLVSERDRLLDRLSEAEAHIKRLTQVGSDANEVKQLRQRLQKMTTELRQLRSVNGDLECKLAASSAGAANGSASSSSSSWDWESCKMSLLEQLESDFDRTDPQPREERLKYEQVVRITEQVVAQKNDEIRDLKRLLEQQPTCFADVAIGAAAIGDEIDHNELILQERENLRAMQDQWREMMRQAEIEISTERAKLARERMDLDEKLAILQRSQPSGPTVAADDNYNRPARRHWLARLGLLDPEDY